MRIVVRIVHNLSCIALGMFLGWLYKWLRRKRNDETSQDFEHDETEGL